MTDETKTALLSKLRAPVADERAALSQYDYQALFDAIGKAVKVHPNLAIEISVQAFRAALASAPVAGEAVAMRRDERLREAAANFLNAYRVRYGGVYGQIKKHAPLQDQVLALVFASREAPPADDAAPQASEAVREKDIMRFNIHGTIINPHPNGMYVRYEDHRAALSAQPGAQRGGSDAG